MDTIHHRGESLSLRTRKTEEQAIDDLRYGTQDIKFIGCMELDIKTGKKDSEKAKGSFRSIQAAISAMNASQVAALTAGCFAQKGNTGDPGFRGNVSDVKSSSAAISGAAAFVAIIPLIALISAGKEAPAYAENNLKGASGSGTPNANGILFDACEPTGGGKFVAKGVGAELNAISRSKAKSSLKFDPHGSIRMNAKKCSLETDEHDGQASVVLGNDSFVAKSYADEEANSALSIYPASMKLRHNKHEIVLLSDAVLADSLRITSGGASMPGMTITSTGLVNVNS